MKGLQLAAAAGQRIYQITQANQTSTLANLNLDAATETEIQNAVNAGKEVITHTDPVSVPGYTGAGYIIIDPVTGDGAYKISGGGNGGLMIIKAIFEVTFWMFDSVKGIAKANIVIGVLQLIEAIYDTWQSCSGTDLILMLSVQIAFFIAMVGLSYATAGAGTLLVYSLGFSTAADVVFGAGIQRFCN